MEDASAGTWWWTVSNGGTCDGCALPLRGQRIAYEPHSRTAYCTECAQVEGVAELAQESRRAKRARAEAAALQLT